MMLIPVGGTYVMTYEEIVQAVEKINPKLTTPIHFGSITRNRIDTEKFSDLASCRVEILDKED